MTTANSPTRIRFTERSSDVSIAHCVFTEEVVEWEENNPGSRHNWSAILHRIASRADGTVVQSVRESINNSLWGVQRCEPLKKLSHRAAGALRRTHVNRMLVELRENRQSHRRLHRERDAVAEAELRQQQQQDQEWQEWQQQQHQYASAATEEHDLDDSMEPEEEAGKPQHYQEQRE